MVCLLVAIQQFIITHEYSVEFGNFYYDFIIGYIMQ